MDEPQQGLLEEFSEIVAATRGLLQADSARGVQGYGAAPSLPVEAPHEAVVVTAPAATPAAPAAMESVATEDRPLSPTRDRVVGFKEGSGIQRVVIVGGFPQAEELASQRPFQGEGGEMLNKMLTHVVKLPRERVVLAMAASGFPVGTGATYSEGELAYRRFVESIIAEHRPQLVLAMGELATRVVLGGEHDLKQSRGTWHVLGGASSIATFDPKHLLANPGDKKYTFADLKSIHQKLASLAKGA